MMSEQQHEQSPSFPDTDTDTTTNTAIDKEVARLRALQSYHILDDNNPTTPNTARPMDGKLIRHCALAARALRAKVARLVVIDLDRCWTVASSLEEDDGAPRDMPRKRNIYESILPWQQQQQQQHNNNGNDHPRETSPPPPPSSSVMVVPDLDSYSGPDDGGNFILDTRYLSHGEERMRFYAGAPVINQEGHVLGTLAVLDTEPRTLPTSNPDEVAAFQNQLEILQTLARSMVDLMEEKRQRILSGANSDNSFQPTLLRSSRFVIQQLQTIVQDDNLVSMLRHYQLEGLSSSLEAAKFLEAALLQQKERERRQGGKDDDDNASPEGYSYAGLNPCHGGATTASGPAAAGGGARPPPWSLENDPSLNNFSTRVIELKNDSTNVF
mmetsp:Transcript_22483/g.62396  ORF Transcript_22483/g.62396 Transcript_22483/m.62396 type:complete len:383 (-) Transcript_22483:436-1584(-)